MTARKVPALPADGQHELMALANNSWGRGATARDARRNLSRNTGVPVKEYRVVPKGARIDDLGFEIVWNLKDHPATMRDCPHCYHAPVKGGAL
jgi:hypothetical protein